MTDFVVWPINLFSFVVLPELWIAPDGKNDGTMSGNGIDGSSMHFHQDWDHILFWKSKFFNNLNPIRQRWHPVSAIAEI